MKRTQKPDYSAGAIIRTRLFTEGLSLLRFMAKRPVSRQDAAIEPKIHPRRWYRWLKTFARCEIPLAIDTRLLRLPADHGPRTEKTYRLWREDWLKLLDPKSAPRKRPITGRRDPTKREIIKAVEGALKSVLR